MKKIKNLTLILASFIAGITFIISCGGSIKSFAEDTVTAALTALEVSFDKTDTSLDSETTQDAIAEIAKALPFVYDATGKKIGIFAGYFYNKWVMYDLKERAPLLIEPVTGSLVGANDSNLVYATPDCTETAYYPLGHDAIKVDTGKYINEDTHVLYIEGKIYWYNPSGSKILLTDIKSYKSADGTCTTWTPTEADDTSTISTPSVISSGDAYYVTPIFIEAKEITITPYTGPLSIY